MRELRKRSKIGFFVRSFVRCIIRDEVGVQLTYFIIYVVML